MSCKKDIIWVKKISGNIIIELKFHGLTTVE